MHGGPCHTVALDVRSFPAVYDPDRVSFRGCHGKQGQSPHLTTASISARDLIFRCHEQLSFDQTLAGIITVPFHGKFGYWLSLHVELEHERNAVNMLGYHSKDYARASVHRLSIHHTY
jgi:hypothetical protein